MKKLTILLAFIAMAFSMNAQNFENDYTYGFWSNWSAGLGIQYSKNFTDNWGFGEGSNLGFELRGQKQLGRHWDMRIIANVPGVFTSDTNQFDRYAMGLVGFSWTPWNHFYLFADGGIGVKRDSFNWLALAADGGIGVKFDVCKASTIYGELGLDCIADITEDMTYNNVFVKVGWMHRFGLTKVDEEILAQRKMLAVEKAVANTTNCNSLVNQLAKYNNRELELVNRINVLEEHDVELTKRIEGLTKENDSLSSIIESLHNDQTNFFALPFSVIFDNDSYTVNASEYDKIKAVASIMKDDTTIHYSVVGFCDKTGSQEYNQKLSEKRAEAVKKLLVKYGVKEEQITTSGNGYEKPFSNGKLAVNRRVSFYKNF